jgi:hypothetical protein
MKRRVLLAVLFALAVVALAFAGCGDTNHRDAEAVKGKPWKGTSGVTRSVTSIAARQEALERHPPSLPADKAEEQQAEEQQAEEEGGESGEAAGETAEARAVPAGAPIGEKPEPGEESGPPKTAVPAARQQRTGRSAIAPSSELTANTSFLGAQTNESGFVPPDSMGAVGPSQILVDVNGRIKVFDKGGNLGGLNATDSAFWAPVRNGTEPTDPGVEYDRLSQRWIVSAIDTEPTNNRVMLAVSDGPTITSASDFTFFFFNEASPPPSGPARFADYPQLAVDANAIYIGVNEFTSSTGSFTGTSAYVIRKSSVLGAGPIVVTAFRALTNGIGPGPDSPQPATNMDPNVNAGYIVGPDNQFLSRLDVQRISDPGGTPSISSNLVVTVPTTSVPLSVPAQGTPGGIDALDDRLFEAMIGKAPDGSDSLWTAHNIAVDSSGSAPGNRDAARWYQLGTLDTTPSLVQSGTLFDTAVSNPRFFWMPSIAMSGQGHASLNTSTAGVGRHAEVASSGQLASDPIGTTEPFDITQISTFAYNLGTSSPRRWGDYSQTVVDPNDNMTFWTFQEYANAGNSWGVRVIQLQAPPPADPSTASPSNVPLGQCSVAVDVDGTTTSGSGFFDPGADSGGPGYPNHIQASVTGGVAVNGVTYVDPTHLTLDLDTRSATSGPQDVTITNPDGQEATGTGVITVDTPASGPTTPCLNGTTPDSPANNNSPEIFGSADAGSTVQIYTDSGCAGTPVGTGTDSDFASPGIPVDPVADDSSTTYYATATDALSAVSSCSSTLPTPSGSVTYIEDSTPPVPSVDSGPSGVTNDRTPTFSFSATDPVGPINFQCSIDTGTPSFGACSGPGNTDTAPSPLADGPHTFRVKATDAAGNSAVATQAFDVDGTPPSVSVDSGPSGVTTDQTPTFTFSATDAAGPIAFFRCSIDTGTASFGVCSGPGNSDAPASPLADDSYRFRVRATDGAGNSAIASRSFTVQTPQPPPPAPSAPDTTITKGPKKKTNKRRPKFKFTSSQAGSSFQCKLDRGTFQPCVSPFKPAAKLSVGKHVFSVQAANSAGNVDPSPAVRKFKVLPNQG